MSSVAYYNRQVKPVSSLNQSQKMKPFCKICYDSGKPESLYSNHFVRESRDINSRVVCPTLLSVSCRFCGVRGHTVSKCKKALMTPTKYNVEYKKINEADIKSVKKNLFDCLSDEEEDNMDTVSDVSTVFPMLSERCAPCTPPRSEISYASVLCAPAPVKNRNLCDSVSTTVGHLSVAQKLRFSKSWSDYDSDSDEE
jgi:hypothetical protein